MGIGQLAISADPLDVLVAYGLGSCVGVSAFDPCHNIAGMVHVLLPSSENATPGREPARFADLGIDLLLDQLGDAGASRAKLRIKVAGGASVLGPGTGEKFKIGARNAEAVKARFRHHGLQVLSEELGGNSGRTLEMYVATGKTYFRTAASPATEL